MISFLNQNERGRFRPRFSPPPLFFYPLFEALILGPYILLLELVGRGKRGREKKKKVGVRQRR